MSEDVSGGAEGAFVAAAGQNGALARDAGDKVGDARLEEQSGGGQRGAEMVREAVWEPLADDGVKEDEAEGRGEAGASAAEESISGVGRAPALSREADLEPWLGEGAKMDEADDREEPGASAAEESIDGVNKAPAPAQEVGQEPLAGEGMKIDEADDKVESDAVAVEEPIAGGESAPPLAREAGQEPLADEATKNDEVEERRESDLAADVEEEEKVKQPLKVDDLCLIGGADPPTPKLTEPISAQMYEEIDYFYKEEYGRGIDSFLETTWYLHKGHAVLRQDHKLCEMFAGMLAILAATPSNDYDTQRKLPSTEARMVWQLMKLPRAAAGSAAPVHDRGRDDLELDTVLRRLDIFENLILGRIMPANPLSPSATGSYAVPGAPHYRATRFWQSLGFFVSLPLIAPAQIEQTLAQTRILLDEKENRDVLYSIAIVRQYGVYGAANSALYHPQMDPKDERAMQLAVAKKFIEDEAAGQGQSQVVQRLCGMAARSWQLLREQ